MAKNENKKTSEAKVKVVASNIADAYVDYAVKAQLKAADVPPRKALDIKFTDTSKIGDTKSKTNQEAYEKAHGKLYDMTHKNTVPWKNWVVYIVLISMLSCCFTFSKYMSEASGFSSATVAKFNVETRGGNTSQLANDINIETDGVNNCSSLIFDTDDSKKTFFIKVTSDSDVAVNVSIERTDTVSAFTGSFNNNTNSATGIIDKNSSSDVLIFAYTLNKPTIPADAELDDDDYYSFENPLEFSVVVDQID